jgi:hypothetical protein
MNNLAFLSRLDILMRDLPVCPRSMARFHEVPLSRKLYRFRAHGSELRAFFL